VWIGMALVWGGYSVGLWGWSLVRGYNLSAKDLISPTGWYSGKWPPEAASPDVIIPGQKTPPGAQTAQLTLANTGAGTPAQDGGGGVTPGQPAGGLANVAIIRAVAAQRGWGSGGQWNAITHIVASESGGSTTAQNPSGALGIAQALGHGTSCSSGTLGNEYGPQFGLTCAQAREANSGNALQQARWFIGYLQSRYGTPANAWAFHLKNNYY